MRLNTSGARWLRGVLLSTALLDELTFGFLVVGLPLARDTFHMTYEQIGLLFTAGAIAALAIEPVINLASDHISKRVPILAGMFCLMGTFALAGLTDRYVLLVLAVALADPAIGAAVGLSQAALVEQQPNTATRTMARWTMLSSVGDLLSPLVVAATVAIGGGWTALSLMAAALWLLAAGVALPLRFPRPAVSLTSDGESASSAWVEMRQAIVAALHDWVLFRWMGILFMATMVDEIFLGFAGLMLHDRLHATVQSTSLILALGMIGGMVGLLMLERVLARSSDQQRAGIRLLPWLALLTLAGIVALLLAQALWLGAVALFAIGLGATGWYPVARAATYERLPGHAGLARAITGLVMPLELILPAVVGVLASQFGLVTALGFLGLAPVGVLLLAPRASKRAVRVSRETA